MVNREPAGNINHSVLPCYVLGLYWVIIDWDVASIIGFIPWLPTQLTAAIVACFCTYGYKSYRTATPLQSMNSSPPKYPKRHWQPIKLLVSFAAEHWNCARSCNCRRHPPKTYTFYCNLGLALVSMIWWHDTVSGFTWQCWFKEWRKKQWKQFVRSFVLDEGHVTLDKIAFYWCRLMEIWTRLNSFIFNTSDLRLSHFSSKPEFQKLERQGMSNRRLLVSKLWPSSFVWWN